MTLYNRTMSSPVGELTLVANSSALVALLWENDKPRRVPLPVSVRSHEHPILELAISQLNEYFAGDRAHFTVPLAPIGTPFQLSVWKGLEAIPYGTTVSYSDLAQTVGSPKAFRAVGSANGRNPISIIVPCHRVIASSGQLAGFAGGLDAKRTLLELETRMREKWHR